MAVQDMSAALGLHHGRVLVVGDVMLDRYWFGGTARISPEAPVPVVNIDRDDLRPGGAANVAVNVASLGARVTLLGVVGCDEQASLLESLTVKQGVLTDFVASPASPTITKLRIVSRNQQLIRLDFENSPLASDKRDRAALLARFRQALDAADAVILSDYGKGTLSMASELIEAARCAGKPVLVDPKGTDYRCYAGATMITPNMGEFEAVAGRCADENELVRKGAALRAELGLRALLVTRGEQGMTLLLPDMAPMHLPAQAREVFDVTGAGDTVIATVGAALATGKDLVSACMLGNLAAGIVVGKFGTATVTSAELALAVHSADGCAASVLSEDELLMRVCRAKVSGKRIVFTNGCFDLLHVGHLRYLEAAKRLGDVLVVAINDDDSVARLKGPSRPVNRCEDRMHLLAGMKCVDWVVKFSEDTPERLIRNVLPHVLVKGGDYSVEQIIGYDTVQSNGGTVVALDFHEGYSTTQLIEHATLLQNGQRSPMSAAGYQ
ncbi:MAG TPA: bifunctional heptose 7-phosphate kinase/heptose 1-phosphate adenyltransferase [Oxalobacteraceae bacterium]|nr:bifunctional heptose 7-phosphate kinase/heptose 1-phosphate adenyltransferase [Oxalobacteraceae bacterium]